MKEGKRWIKAAVAVAAVLLAASVVAFYYARYWKYDDYKRYLEDYDSREGTEFAPIMEASSDVNGMVLAAENDVLKLYVDPATTEIAVYEKESRNITRSNPAERDADMVAAGVNKELLSATLDITYYTSKYNRMTANNYGLSIRHKQFEIQSLEDGIKFIYLLEDPDSSTGIVPLRISEERFQTLILDKLSGMDASKMKGRYEQKDGYYYLLESNLKSRMTILRMNETFEDCGYTYEDYIADMEGVEGAEVVSFTISMECRLTDHGLEVSVPVNEIEERGGSKISRIRLLPFFGAADSEAEGYIFVPNGSGALIYLNNKSTGQAYMQNVYGMDPVAQSFLVTEELETVRMPVFGMKQGNQAYVGRITEGDALGIINADVAGKTNNYNYVYAEFSVREYEVMNMFGVTNKRAGIPLVEEGLYDERLSVTYSFLSGESADYSGMAECYRKQLTEEGILKPGGAEREALPFYLDILGGVEIQKRICGVPYDGVYPMTTFEQAEELVAMLYAADIPYVRMNYHGWMNGGIYHDVADKIELARELGDRKELEELGRKLKSGGGELFVDVAFQKVPYTSKRFQYVFEASKYYSGYVVQLGALNPATMRQTSNLHWYDELVYYIISPKYLPWYVEHFVEEMDSFEMGGIALRDLGDILAPDRKRNEPIQRQAAKEIVLAQYQKLSDTGRKLMVKGGNAYTFGYVTDIVDAPMYYSKFSIVDEQVPFYQMVIHGSIHYSGGALNLMERDVDKELLLSWIEYGAAPRYVFSYEDSGNIKYTSSADMYSVQYSTWMEDAVDKYRFMAEALSPVEGAAMLHHQVLENGLVEVRYDNGICIYVNKTDHALLTEEGISVEGLSYRMTGGTE